MKVKVIYLSDIGLGMGYDEMSNFGASQWQGHRVYFSLEGDRTISKVRRQLHAGKTVFVDIDANAPSVQMFALND